jgi:hypothetical protein
LRNTHPDQRLITDEEASEIQYFLDVNKKLVMVRWEEKLIAPIIIENMLTKVG